MKHSYLLTIMFIAILPSKAMEKPDKHNILAKIKTAGKPLFAQYLNCDSDGQERVVIVSEKEIFSMYSANSKDLLVEIVNPENNEIIKDIIKKSYNYSKEHGLVKTDPIILAVHPNKQKFAISLATIVTIYDSQTYKPVRAVYIDDPIDAVTFSAAEDAMFITCNKYERPYKGTKIVRFDYTTMNQDSKIVYNDILLRPNIALHPTQPIIYAGNHKRQLFFLPSNQTDKQQTTTKTIDNVYTECDYQYNHDGSLVIAHDLSNIYIVAHDINKEKSITDDHNPIVKIKFKDDKPMAFPIKKVIFYPESLILTILFSTENAGKQILNIRYWDIQTKKGIHTMPILDVKRFHIITSSNLSFSPDKTNLLVTLNNKCIIVPVPLEVQNIA